MAFNLLAIDPGDVHNGIAYFGAEDLMVERKWTRDWTEQTLFDFIETRKHEIDAVVIEEYRLYPELAFEQGYSDFPTVQVIGIVRYLCSKHGINFTKQGASIKRRARRVGERMNMPGEIRMLGAGRNKYRGWDFDGPTQHERDATAHGIWYLFNNESSPAKGTDNRKSGVVVLCRS